MAFIQMTKSQGAAYRAYLDSYRRQTGREPGSVQRTEAFICARSTDPWRRPAWVAHQ